jgi:hypothetical protein
MISARCQPAIEAGQQGEWRLVLSMGRAFDYATPFRAVLDEIADALSREAHVTVQLPEYEAFEDFVEGKLYFGREAIHVYFEHSLGYLFLSSDNKIALRRIAELIQPGMTVT